ncbi:MAG: DUF819 family protein [Bdellovibrionales bacterium]|nr:DUF819 family protein [Bdellovibrionales bacterium]
MIQDPMAVLAVLLVVLAALFSLAAHPRFGKLFNVVPLLVFAYFIPTLLSNTHIIPLESPTYTFIKKWLLPSSLLLLTMSVDIPAIMGLGKKVLYLFFGATAGIVIGAPLAYLAFGWMIPAEIGDEAWKGLAALSGSWIGGGANFIAIGESVGAKPETINMMVIVDVAVASVWMAVLLYFAGREKEIDASIGADRSALEVLRKKVEAYQLQVARPAKLPDLLTIAALAFGGTVLASWFSKMLPEFGGIVTGFTWVVIIVTTIGVGLSFTDFRKLEGAGASAVGSVFLYLLVATIGAQGNFAAVLDAPAMVVIGSVWMLFHAVTILLLCRFLKAPIFFAAVGSQANVGAAASAPIVASAFHPALAPVGVLLAVLGYVLGTYMGLVCAFLLQMVHQFIF